MQIRGLSPRSAEDFAETIIGAGLANTNPLLESVRNVMASPLGPDDPSAAFDSHAVARDIEAMLCRRARALGAAVEFGILVDGGGVLPLADIAADIMVRAQEGRLPSSSTAGRLLRCAHRSLTETAKALRSPSFACPRNGARSRAACARW